MQSFSATDIDRWFRKALWGLVAVFGGLRVWLDEPSIWIGSGFIIVTAGMVGYYTNFLAIKMLFQPKRGKVLGWAGLVPKNKPQIARSLGESVQHQLLSPEIILDYMQQYRMVERGTEQLSEWLDQMLNDPDVRRVITETIVNWLQNNGASVLEKLLDVAETALTGIARDPKQVQQSWHSIREIIEEYLNDEANRRYLAERVRQLLQKDLPRIAEKIDEAIEDYLKSRNTVGTVGMSVKRLFSVDEDTIEGALQRFMDDPEATGKLVGILDLLADELIAQLHSEETQKLIADRLENWVAFTAKFSRESVLPRAISHLEIYLTEPEYWDDIERFILDILEQGKNSALAFISSEKGQAFLKGVIDRVVRRINVIDLVEQQVMQLDTDELEEMILNNTGGNLVVIQTLGGTLGLVAGLVQVNLMFAVPLAAGVGGVWLLLILNQYRHRNDEA